MLRLRGLDAHVVAACLIGGAWGCDDRAAEPGPEGDVTGSADAVNAALVTPVHVRVALAGMTDLSRETTAAGVVEAFRTATVAAETHGRVTLRSVEPGDRVDAGQVLVNLDSERARIARDEAGAMVRSREIDLREAHNELRRGQDLHARQFISRDVLERLHFAQARAAAGLRAARSQLAAAERVLADAEVRAPFPGIAEHVHVHEGDYVNPGTPVATLADFGRARIRAGITAREAALLTGVGHADLTLDVLGAEPLRATINSVARVSEPATGTYALELWLTDIAEDVRGGLREGMLATVHLPHGGAAARLTVPSAAVFRRDGAMHVFVVNDGHAELRPVHTGRSNGPVIEILEGLAAGETVVTDGQFALRDGARVIVED
ncbi:MAG: efflux RND transporter periplasmic adaptor subunit [Gammaproteobacteria bacterium]|nr:efflux RND transporter periplasmic adaptor subunit [Gammaproteobacteria bacterium]